MPDDPNTTAKHPMEEDVSLPDGSVVRVTGLLAVKFRTDPDAVRKFVEDDWTRRGSAETHG